MRNSIQCRGPNAPVQPSDNPSLSERISAAWRRPAGHLPFAGLLACLLFLSFSAPSVLAHSIPPGCTGSGLGVLLFTDAPDVHIGDTLNYSATVFNGTGVGAVVCDATSIQAFVVTPDGVSHPIVLRRTTLTNGQSDYYTNVVSYVVRAQDVQPDGTVRATASDTGIIHQNDTDSQGGGNQGVNTEVSLPCIQITVQCVGSIGESGAINFTGTVTNCGNNTLVGVTVTNFVNGGQFHVTFITNLLRNQVATFSGSWIPSNPCFPSTATFVAQGIDQFTTRPRTVTSSASTTCSEVLTPGIKVTKTCPAGPVSPGQLLVFSGSVSNTGNVTLNNIVVVNDQPAANTQVFTLASLAPGAVASFTGSYTAPTNCAVSDTLTARAASVCGVAVTDSASATCPIVTTPQIVVTAVCPAGPVTPGSSVTYTGTVRNTGNITLNNIVVVSDRPSANTTVFTVASLAPGASANYTGSFTVPPSACTVTTTVAATGKDSCTGNTAANSVSATCTVVTTPGLALTLACPAAQIATGGLMIYTGTVRNTGNVTLNNVVVVNNQSVPSTVKTILFLAPGASENFTASFTAPLDACSITSTVTSSGTDACTGVGVSANTSATCSLVTTPRLVVTQNCPASPASLGGVLTYTGTVSNAGDVTLTNIVVVNDLTGSTPVFVTGILAPGATATFSGSYTVPANNGCAITSTLTASGSDKCTSTRVSANVTTTCSVLGAPRIAVTLACPAVSPALGGTLTYSGTVSNPGNVTLTNVVVTSDVPALNTVVFSRASLAPGASATFTGSYTVPSSDTCSIVTSVTARASDQCGSSGVLETASIACPLVTNPAIVVTQLCPVVPGAPGGLLVYTATVRNSGNVTLTNIVVVSSQPAANTVVFSLATLAPGASANFNSSFNAPLDACSATSTLAASAKDRCTSATVNNSVTTTCPLTTSPSLAVTKACPVIPVTEGGVLIFTGTVTNTGNITLTNVTVVNDKPAAGTRVLGPITLAPGAGTNFTGSYTAPLNNCTVTDTLVATANDKCTGVPVSTTVSATCPITTIPRIAVTLACPVVPSVTGGLITFTGTVSNPGNVTLNNVTVVNNQSVPSTVLTVLFLTPGMSVNFTSSFTAPADACSVNATVSTSGTDACSGVGASATASATCPLVTAPSMTVSQTCPAPVAFGRILTFTGAVKNTGNVTLTNVVVTNNRVGSTPVFTAATLAPGATASFTGSYNVPVDAGCSITSTVTASAADACSNVRITANSSATCPLVTAPSITVTQSCPASPVSPGGVLTYNGVVRNTGNVTLTNVVVVNDRSGSTPIFTAALLAPGASANFTGSYVTHSDCCVDSSTVTATGKDICTGVTVSDTATKTCTLLTLPKLAVTKVCPAITLEPGDLLRYSGIVSNAGNITLVNVTVVNNQTGAITLLGPITLVPGESVTYAGSYTVAADSCGTDIVTARGFDACTDLPVASSVTTTCPIITTPRIAITKNCPLLPTPRGGIHTYTGTVSNTGNVTLNNVFVVNNQPALNTPIIGPITLAPGASANFSGSYTAPMDCCETTDTLSVRGQDLCTGTRVTATASAICPLLTTPAISVTRVCPALPVAVGALYTFSGTVKNTGDVNLTNVFVFSSQPNANTPLLGPIELAPGESEQFTGTYTVTAGSTPANDTVTARGMDTCQARTVSASANCFGPITPAALRITSVISASGTATVTWTAISGRTYVLQCKGNPHDPIWIDIPGNVTATGATATKSDVVSPTRQRFYRVMIVE